MSHSEHRALSPRELNIAVLSASSSRSLDEDKSGHWIVASANDRGMTVVQHAVVLDDIASIRSAVRDTLSVHAPHAILLTGGTGLAKQDVTIEALQPLFEKRISAFGILFAQLSYGQIGAAAMLSRAAAGVIQESLVFCMPGSQKACELACEKLIFAELGHMVHHIEKG